MAAAPSGFRSVFEEDFFMNYLRDRNFELIIYLLNRDLSSDLHKYGYKIRCGLQKSYNVLVLNLELVVNSKGP